MLTIPEFNKIKQPGTKRCSACGEIKPIDMFVKDARRSDGHESRCKPCHQKRLQERRKKPEVQEYYKQYRRSEAGRNYRIQYGRTYYRSKTKGAISPNAPFSVALGPGSIYLIRWQTFFKIGRAIAPEQRANVIIGSLPTTDGKLLHIITTNNMADAELFLHDRYRSCRENGEWFSLSQSQVDEVLSISHIHSDGHSVIPQYK